MKKIIIALLMFICCLQATMAQERRPIDSKHPMWLVHIDVWNKADPQKIIDLIPKEVRPYVCLNLSLSCGFDVDRDVHKMPQNAILTYRSWATVCQKNGMWFTCQPASGGHTHILDNDIETFEYFFKKYPNFLGWNFAEQFWGFGDPNDRFSSVLSERLQLFAKLIEMSHNYGGFLTISFCGNIWSHPLNPTGMMRTCPEMLEASKKYPEAILWLYKYTTSSCFYNNESVSFGPFVSGLANNYGVRYDNCGWNGALDALLGEGHGKKYPTAAGIGTVMEQTCQNGGAVWDGPELIWTEDFKNLSDSKNTAGYTVRNWGTYPGFDNAWIDMFKKIIDGTMYIPTREEVVENTKVIIVNDSEADSYEERFGAWKELYDGLYKQTDPFNRNGGYWMDNFLYLKKTGRYKTIPITPYLNDELAKSIPLQVSKSNRNSVWPNLTTKVNDFNKLYQEVSTGDLFVSRFKNQLVTYTPYSYMNSKKTASATIPLQYNTCQSMELTWGMLSSGLVREYADSISLYLNNYRSDTTTLVNDKIVLNGAITKPTYKFSRRATAGASLSEEWDEATGKYTLNVKHCGPVDVCIKAQGNATDRKTDAMLPVKLEQPKQPEAYSGLVIREAEDMDRLSTKECIVDPFNLRPNVYNHAGNGFVEMGTNTSASLKNIFKVKAKTYIRVGFRYTYPTKDTKMTLTVGTTKTEIDCPKTAVNEWRNVSAKFYATSINATVTLTNSGGEPVVVDQVFVAPWDSPEETWDVIFHESEHGTASADFTSAEEGTKVTLSAVPEKGYNFLGWEIIHGKISIDDNDSFTMPNDNVILKPIFQKANVIYDLDMSKVLAGNLPAGWICAMSSTEKHSYPENYKSGARTMVGFAGKTSRALYWRGLYACYGQQENYRLHLEPGTYIVTAKCAAWKSNPAFKIAIMTLKGSIVKASSAFNCTPNANGYPEITDITNAAEGTLEFTITNADNYELRVNKGSNYADEALLTNITLVNKFDPTAVRLNYSNEITNSGETKIYDASGKRLTVLKKGLNIIVTPDGQNKKVWMK